MNRHSDPAVVTWHLVLAPRPRPAKIGRHWWREYVTDVWRSATEAWEREAEAVAIGYPTELAEFAAAHPRPTLGGVMVGLSSASIVPEREAS